MSQNSLRIFSIFITLFMIKENVCLDLISEYYLDDEALADSACDQVISFKDSVYLRSQAGAGALGGLNSYDPNQDCTTTFTVESGFQILVQFPFFNMPDGNSCSDKLQFQETVTTEEEETVSMNVTKINTFQQCNGTGVNELCWNVTSNYTVLENSTQTVSTESLNTTDICQSPEPHISHTNRLQIKFTSDASVQGAGFTMLLTGFRTTPCNDNTEFLCDTNRCISTALKCDGTDNCLDKTDETKKHASCSVTDKIAGTIRALGKNVVIGIIVVASGIVCVVVIIIIMYQFMDRDSKSSCKSSSVDEEAHEPRTVGIRKIVSNNLSSRLNKQRKSVTIVTEQGHDQRDKRTGVRRNSLRKVAPAKEKDDVW